MFRNPTVNPIKLETGSRPNSAGIPYPDPREDLESRSPNLGPYTTKGTLQEPPLRDLLFGSSRGSGYTLLSRPEALGFRV